MEGILSGQADNVTKFGSLGAELDSATLALRRLQDYVKACKEKPEDFAKKFKVKIEDANFGDGSGYLQEDINRIFPEYLAEILDRAMADRLAGYEETSARLKDAMGVPPAPSSSQGRGQGNGGRQGGRT